MSVPLLRFRFKDSDESFYAPFALPSGQGAKRTKAMQIFAIYLKHFQEEMGFKVSSRGWCYQLEQYGLIDKGQFGSVNRWINE